MYIQRLIAEAKDSTRLEEPQLGYATGAQNQSIAALTVHDFWRNHDSQIQFRS